MSHLTIGSLFSGIGGLELALESFGHHTIWQVENDPYARAVLARHWPDVERFDDVRTVGAANLRPVDIICGGFPCQDISNAGQRAGITGRRSGLWAHFARLIRELRPRYAFVENVAALTARGLGIVLGDLAELGYDAEWECFRAADVGAPHLRNRLFILAYADSAGPRTPPHGRIHRGEAGAGPRDVQPERLDSARWPAVADAGGVGWKGRPTTGDDQPSRESGVARGAIAGASSETDAGGSWWEVEPDVGRVVTRVPAPLDGDRTAEEKHAQEGSAQGDREDHGVPSLWRDGQVGTPPPGLFDAEDGRGPMPAVPHRCRSEGRHQTEERDESLRALRGSIPSGPQPEAQAVQRRMSVGGRENQRKEAMGRKWWAIEPPIGRVASGVPHRVDRLRGLGNAVVPAQAALAWSTLMARIHG